MSRKSIDKVKVENEIYIIHLFWGKVEEGGLEEGEAKECNSFG